MYSSKKYTPWILAGIGVVGVTGYLAYNQGWYDKYMQGSTQKQVAAQTKQAKQLNQRAAFLKQQAAATGDSGLYAEANRCEHQANAIMYKLNQQAAATATAPASQEPVKAAQSAAVQSAAAAQTSADAAKKAVQAAGQHPQAVQAAKQAQTAAQVAKTAATQAKSTQNPTEVAKQTQVAANAAVVATQQANVATQVATQQPAVSAQHPAAQQNMVAEASTGMADQFDVQYPGFPGTELDFISNFNGADEQATKDFQQQQGVPRPTQIGNVHQPVDQFLGSYRDFEFYNSGCEPSSDAYVYSSSDVAPNAPGPMASGIDSATVLKPNLYPDVVSADGFSQITIDGPRAVAYTDNIFDDGTALSRRFNQNFDLRGDQQNQIYNPEMMSGFGISVSTHGAFASNTSAVRETIA